MKTPICDFVRSYAESRPLRLHMPGHKGRGTLGVESLDVTEIDGADVLYSANGIIAESEREASALFGSGATLYSTEGSSLSIRAMLYLASLWGEGEGRARRVIASRNAHRVFTSAAALLDIDVEWIFGEGDGLLSCGVDGQLLDEALRGATQLPFAVYLTSPDYLGNTLDIASIAKVCHRHGVLCIVDNAHGAYLGFLPVSRHPISLGADMCADSAHKTLPVLTGGAYLHISKEAPTVLAEQAERGMALFASTSPSYLTLQSLDAANAYLSDGYRERLALFSDKLSSLKGRLAAAGYTLVGDEPLKLTLSTKPYGYFGFEIGKIMSGQGIVCEFCDRDYAVFMLTPEILETELSRLESALISIERRAPIREAAPRSCGAERVLSLREATLSPSEEVDVKDAVGRVLADASVSCPPAVPILVCGERIDESALECFEYYGIKKCAVVR